MLSGKAVKILPKIDQGQNITEIQWHHNYIVQQVFFIVSSTKLLKQLNDFQIPNSKVFVTTFTLDLVDRLSWVEFFPLRWQVCSSIEYFHSKFKTKKKLAALLTHLHTPTWWSWGHMQIRSIIFLIMWLWLQNCGS